MNILKTLLPAVRRIRGNRLYLSNGKRMLDLYLDNGMRILSYEDSKVKMYAKNAIEKGLTAGYPSLYETRFLKALNLVFGNTQYFITLPHETAAVYLLHECFNFCGKLTELWPPAPEKTPCTHDTTIHTGSQTVYRVRPFLPLHDHCIGVFTVPGLRPINLSVLMFSDTKDYEKAFDFYKKNEEIFLIAPIQHYAGTRSLYSLMKLAGSGYNAQHWKRFTDECKEIFMQNGPYIYPRSGNYNTFFKQALDAGVLINPHEGSPSIIPMEYSSGEIKQLTTCVTE